MCLEIYSRTCPVAKIATEDMYVYKYLKVTGVGDFASVTSPYRGFQYCLGETVSAKMYIGGCGRYYYVDAGLHSFAKFKDAYSYTSNTLNSYYVFVCIIPKGAKYYKGKFGSKISYASDKLIVLHREDPRSMKLIRNLPPKP